ncbi:uncharacterized protein LOC121393347 [Xenopus laevis]|uniref:Uncharacterized protein LOC121393347 n=1 Tax=Xenopus laevis TaxID=8355 RepID=A0A8J1KJU9_XENLA|nr:uncharacterized protein LOC121393347 [Xenopus laevis]
MGLPRSRPDGVTPQPKGSSLLCTLPGSSSIGSRHPHGSVGFSTSLCVPTDSSDTQNNQESTKRKHHSHPNSTKLATASLVLGSPQYFNRGTVDSSINTGPTPPRSNSTSQSSKPQFDCVALETQILKNKGFSDAMISTMRAARKSTSARAYYRVWTSYKQWCLKHKMNFDKFSLPNLLEFLQEGVSLGLSLGSLRSQISALSILFQRRLAFLSDVKTFLQRVAHVAPPFRKPVATWDLTLVLKALQRAPFEPMKSIPLQWVTWKTVFLIAIASARRVSENSALSCRTPFLTFHSDRAVLRTVPTFLPKVVSAFHINQEITIPTFCPLPANPKEAALHSLDLVCALKFYLHRVRDIQKTDSLFVLNSGPQKGASATKTSISRWIKQTVHRAYVAQGVTPPDKIKAHSTRGMSTTWAFCNQASAEQLCKAAMLTSLHSFAKFYHFDTFAAHDTRFGRKVLQAAVGSST